MEFLSRMSSRRPGLVVAVVAAAAVVLALLGSRLRLETDLVALLPGGAPEAAEYSRFLELFGGFEKVFVLIVPAAAEKSDLDEGDLLAAAEILADRLEQSPEVAAVRSGMMSEDEAFFLRFVVRRALLLVPESALESLEERLRPEAIEQRAAQLRAQLNAPSGALQAQLAAYDPLGFAVDLPLLSGGAELSIDPWTGAFSAPDGDAALLVLTPAGGELDAEGGRRLLATLEQAFEALGEQVPGVRSMAVGGPLYAAQDEAMVRTDMEKTVVGSVLGCALILLLAFGGFWIPSASVGVLAVGLLATAAVLAVSLGSVTAAGLGFAAVLVGLGMDYAIHGGTRFRQARLAGASAEGALTTAFREAGPGIATSALTTAVAFATLGVAHFRPLRELGVVVASGVLAILAATVTLGAALLVLRPEVKPPGRMWRGLDAVVHRLTAFAVARPWWVLAAALVLTVGAVVGVRDLRLNPDLTAMRPANSPVFETEKLLVERFDLGIDTATVVLPGDDLEAVLRLAGETEALLQRHLGSELSVLSPTDWLVAESAVRDRLERFEAAGLATAVGHLEAALRANNLSPRAFEPGLSALAALGAGRDPGPPTREDWPEALTELLEVEAEGRVWAALRLRLPDGLWVEGPPADLLDALRAQAPGVAVASMPRLGAAMRRVAGQDLRRLAVIGLLLVALVVGVSFRGDPRACLLAVVPVALGSLWALGLWGATGRTLDLLSLSVIPILLGIGIDDGLHAVHGARSPGGHRFLLSELSRSVASAGLAMALTTVTTCVGFGSLAFSSIPGLASGGLLVAVGVAACLFATLLVLPALGAISS